jgi:hypothetical protein
MRRDPARRLDGAPPLHVGQPDVVGEAGVGRIVDPDDARPEPALRTVAAGLRAHLHGPSVPPPALDLGEELRYVAAGQRSRATRRWLTAMRTLPGVSGATRRVDPPTEANWAVAGPREDSGQ